MNQLRDLGEFLSPKVLALFLFICEMGLQRRGGLKEDSGLKSLGPGSCVCSGSLSALVPHL